MENSNIGFYREPLYKEHPDIVIGGPIPLELIIAGFHWISTKTYGFFVSMYLPTQYVFYMKPVVVCISKLLDIVTCNNKSKLNML